MNFVLEILQDYPWWSFAVLTIWGFVAWIPVWPENKGNDENTVPFIGLFLLLMLGVVVSVVLWSYSKTMVPYLNHTLFVANITITTSVLWDLWSTKKQAPYKQCPELEIAEEILRCQDFPLLRKEPVAQEVPKIIAILREISRLEISARETKEKKDLAIALHEEVSGKKSSSLEIQRSYDALKKKSAEDLRKRVARYEKEEKLLAEKKAELSMSRERLAEAVKLFEEAREYSELYRKVEEASN